MNIKTIEKNELHKALDLVWKVFKEFEAPDYTKEGIDEFKRFIEYSDIKRKVESKEFLLFGYYIDNNLVGVLGFENRPHISLLFVDMEYQRRGAARALLSEFAGFCKENFTDNKEITVNSSPYAHDIYGKLGFKDNGDENLVNGIRFFPMKFNLEANQ